MIRWRKRIHRMSFLLVDLLCLCLSIGATYQVYNEFFEKKLNLSSLEFTGLTMLLALVFFFVFAAASLYDVIMQEESMISPRVFLRIVFCFTIAMGISGAILFFMHANFSRLYLALFSVIFFFVSFAGKDILKRLQMQGGASKPLNKNILVVGQSEKGSAYIQQMRKYLYLGLNIVGYVHIKKAHTYEGLPHLGGLDQLEEIVKNYVVDEITVVRPLSYDERLAEKLERCQEMGITVTMLLDTHNCNATKAMVAMVGDMPVLKFHTVSLNENQFLAKRILDMAGGTVGMLMFGIAYVFVGPIIKLTSPGPVIFKQKRVGKNGRVFEIWKFRSMGVNAEVQKASLLAANEMSGDFMFKMTNDPRITTIGKFIRKTSIDELPQFWNVMRGDMSLVGTRPPTVDEVSKYENHHHRRISITPGITGNWQISGRSDIEDFEEVVRLDTEYISNWTVWSDIKILFKTVYVVVFGKGSK